MIFTLLAALTIVALAALVVVGTLAFATGAGSMGEFLSRPVCFVAGHDLNRYMYPTRYEGRPAHVWRCQRCLNPVTAVQP